MRAQKKWLEIRGHRLYLERYDGERSCLIVLLHHGLGSVQAWRAQIDFLVQQGYSVFVYDRWGYGQSDGRAQLDPPLFEEDVHDLEQLLSHETHPLVLVGHSDGGNIALHYASRHPENLLGLLIVAAHIYFEPKMAEGMLGLLRAYRENESFGRALNAVHGGKPVFERWYQAWSQCSRGWDLRQLISKISCPVVVVQGSEDEHASPQQARDFAAVLPKGRLQLVEAANHMLPQKFSGTFNQILLENLDDFEKVSQDVQ